MIPLPFLSFLVIGSCYLLLEFYIWIYQKGDRNE